MVDSCRNEGTYHAPQNGFIRGIKSLSYVEKAVVLDVNHISKPFKDQLATSKTHLFPRLHTIVLGPTVWAAKFETGRPIRPPPAHIFHLLASSPCTQICIYPEPIPYFQRREQVKPDSNPDDELFSLFPNLDHITYHDVFRTNVSAGSGRPIKHTYIFALPPKKRAEVELGTYEDFILGDRYQQIINIVFIQADVDNALPIPPPGLSWTFVNATNGTIPSVESTSTSVQEVQMNLWKHANESVGWFSDENQFLPTAERENKEAWQKLIKFEEWEERDGEGKKKRWGKCGCGGEL